MLFCFHLPLEMVGHLFELAWHLFEESWFFYARCIALIRVELHQTCSKSISVFALSCYYIPLEKMWFFIWINLKYPDPNIICANVGYNCQLLPVNKVRDWESEEGWLSPLSSLHNMGSFLFTKPGVSERVVGKWDDS